MRPTGLPTSRLVLLALVLTAGLTACNSLDRRPGSGNALDLRAGDDARGGQAGGGDARTSIDSGLNVALALQEADLLLSDLAARTGHPKEFFSTPRFSEEQNVFLTSTIDLADLEDPDRANATVPLYRGVGPAGDDVYYIVTEASDFQVARMLGVNYAPQMVHGRGTGGDQAVTLDGQRLTFKGAVDFSYDRVVVAGDGPSAFPPSVARPGAVADAAWSSLVVLPSGLVLNAQVIANRSGLHDRVVRIDADRRTVTLELLDGMQGGDQLYYHFVTDASDPLAAALEKGVYAPRLANLPTPGQSTPDGQSVLLGFSPTMNGPTGTDNPERQGLNSLIVDGDLDPINVFPFDPDNGRESGNNYSPMWDIHLNMWTDAAIAAGQRRRITGFEDLGDLVEAGLVTSFAGSPGPANEFVMGLRATNAVINCPVIAQPFEGSRR